MISLPTWVRNPSVHTAFAFFAMGGWAIYANHKHSISQQMLSGLVQGLISASITRVLQRMIEKLVRQLSGLFRAVVPPLASFLLSLVVLTSLHRLSGTPELAATIALPLFVSTSYAVFYTWTLIGGGEDA
jgi:LytS/YehU family sensor histidine kinase